MDLTGAEAVIDLIDAETAAAAKNASGQLGGAVIRKTEGIYSALLDMIAHFHAVVDYPDEDIDEFELSQYDSLLSSSETELSALLATFERGKLMKDGVKCAIVGRPNVGKSSLLNALLGYERAIVTDIAGTTRDTVEEKCVVGGVLLRLIDTAGIRKTENTVEKLGVERSKLAMEGADLILAVIDTSEELTDEDREVIRVAEESAKPWILVENKTDIGAGCDISAPKIVEISAKTGAGLDALGAAIGELFAAAPVPQGEILTNARQAEEVRRALSAIKGARAALRTGVTPDAVLTEAEDAMLSLGALSGKNLRQDVTDRIFQRFCVGK
jgi:tRNA modification GTPase